jgi:hypothetical protein
MGIKILITGIPLLVVLLHMGGVSIKSMQLPQNDEISIIVRNHEQKRQEYIVATNEQRAVLWKNRIHTLMEQGKLSVSENKYFSKLTDLIQPLFFDGNTKSYEALNELAIEAKQVFGKHRAAAYFCSFYENIQVFEAALAFEQQMIMDGPKIPNCNCNTKSDFCFGFSDCTTSADSCNVKSGCGFLWAYDCNGVCK